MLKICKPKSRIPSIPTELFTIRGGFIETSLMVSPPGILTAAKTSVIWHHKSVITKNDRKKKQDL